ncbi:hypothetical protein K2X89_14370 [Myxococcota bacterium]|nr:hypothetical protein [Myxococcota bacterium]
MDQPKYGVVYKVQPEPMDPSACTRFDAGPVAFVLEYRSVDPERLERAYAGRPEDLAEILRSMPEGGFTDTGLSIHVLGTKDDHEYLRFDVFKDDPHYHYVHPTGDRNHWVPFDPVAGGDMFEFALGCLRERLPSMLAFAGGRELAEEVDPRRVAPVVDALEKRARAIQAENRLASA